MRSAHEQGAGPVTVGLTTKLRLLVRPTVPVSTALWCDTKSHCLVCSRICLNIWYVPTSSYAGVPATRCVVGAKPRGQCTGSRRILLRQGPGTGDMVKSDECPQASSMSTDLRGLTGRRPLPVFAASGQVAGFITARTELSYRRRREHT